MRILAPFFLPVLQWRLVFLSTKRLLLRKTFGRKLSIFWLVIEPAVLVLMMSVIFPMIFSFRTKDYASFLLSGLLAWNFISGSLQRSSSVIRARLSYMRKTGVAAEILVAAQVLELFSYMLLTSFVLLSFSFLIGLTIDFSFGLFFYACLLSVLSAYGLGLFLGVCGVYLPDIQNLISMLIRGLFFLTPIIYPISRIPEQYAIYMELNPVYQYLRLFRYSIYYSDPLSLQQILYPLFLCIVCLLLGVGAMYFSDRRYLLRVSL